MSATNDTRLKPEQLRWELDPASLDFKTTDDVDPAAGVLGQESALEALRFALECDAPGQNVYVRGPRGTGRLTMVRRLLEELSPVSTSKRDRCYVHNFSRPDHPRLITLAPGQARVFKRRVAEAADFIADGFMQSLDAEPYSSERAQIQTRIENDVREISEPLEKDLKANGMALVSMQQGPVAQTAIVPLVDGQPVPVAQFHALHGEGKVSKERVDQFEELYPSFQKRLQDMTRAISDVYRKGAREVEAINERATRMVLGDLVNGITEEFPHESVRVFVEELIEDVVETRLEPGQELPDPRELYSVNIVLGHTDTRRKPVIEENTPSVINLLGTVEPVASGPGGMAVSDHRGINAGAILRADCGYLVLDVNDLLQEPGAWAALMRTLRTGRLEIVPPEAGWMRPYSVVQPEPVDIHVRVILVGDAGTYYKLDHYDPDFSELFKVLADFDSEIPRNAGGVDQYAAVISHLAHSESLLPFDRTAIASLSEHGARIASRANKLTARFGRIADIAREASFLAENAKAAAVAEAHVENAIVRTKQRASLPSRKFKEMVNSGTIIVETQGEVVGQVNGLAVIKSGPLTYGFPARITATIGAGSAGLINVEGRAQMSGSIHTKGFHILGGLLRHLLNTRHPLAFSASIAFEQSYGGIDGDSASGVETVCLMSALTGIPVKQSMAMTGAIDQLGHVQAIGGVNEKIEGFFDACAFKGLTGDQGAIIPTSNAGDLMLRQDVVEACAAGKFHIYAVDNIQQAMEIMMGQPAGIPDADGKYKEGTILRTAVDRAEEFWKLTLASPAKFTSVETEGDVPVPQPEPEPLPPGLRDDSR